MIKRLFRTKFIRWTFITFVTLAILIQLYPYGHNQANPPVQGEPAWDSPQTRELFDRACADCHSNKTKWVWYSYIAPVSWYIQRDVEGGRANFNVSEWGRAGRNEGDEAAEEVQKGAMPLPIYLRMHPEARLTGAEKQQLIQGLQATFGGKRSLRHETEENE
jgi:hypothetical protein